LRPKSTPKSSCRLRRTSQAAAKLEAILLGPLQGIVVVVGPALHIERDVLDELVADGDEVDEISVPPVVGAVLQNIDLRRPSSAMLAVCAASSTPGVWTPTRIARGTGGLERSPWRGLPAQLSSRIPAVAITARSDYLRAPNLLSVRSIAQSTWGATVCQDLVRETDLNDKVCKIGKMTKETRRTP
jgi:hypothetical protein